MTRTRYDSICEKCWGNRESSVFIGPRTPPRIDHITRALALSASLHCPGVGCAHGREGDDPESPLHFYILIVLSLGLASEEYILRSTDRTGLPILHRYAVAETRIYLSCSHLRRRFSHVDSSRRGLQPHQPMAPLHKHDAGTRPVRRWNRKQPPHERGISRLQLVHADPVVPGRQGQGVARAFPAASPL